MTDIKKRISGVKITTRIHVNNYVKIQFEVIFVKLNISTWRNLQFML